MNPTLSKNFIRILKIIVNIWATIVTIITSLTIFVFFYRGGYKHPIVLFVCIFAITSYINVFKFYKMIYSNSQINLLQLKIWAIFLVSGIFISCAYLAFYAMNIFAIAFFLSAYILTFFCNHYLIKVENNENKKNILFYNVAIIF